MRSWAWPTLGSRWGLSIPTGRRRLPRRSAIQAPSEPAIAEFKGNPEAFNVVIIDSPPRLDERPFLRELADCDLCVIVTQPSLADRETQESARQLADPGTRQEDGAAFEWAKARADLLARVSRASETGGRGHSDARQSHFAFHWIAKCYKHSFGGGWAALDDAGQLAPHSCNSILAAAKAESIALCPKALDQICWPR